MEENGKHPMSLYKEKVSEWYEMAKNFIRSNSSEILRVALDAVSCGRKSFPLFRVYTQGPISPGDQLYKSDGVLWDPLHLADSPLFRMICINELSREFFPGHSLTENYVSGRNVDLENHWTVYLEVTFEYVIS